MNVTWNKIDEETYDEALGMLPPAFQSGNGFLMGEPATHRRCSIHLGIKPTFHAYLSISGAFYKADRPLTVAEFIQVSTHPELPR